MIFLSLQEPLYRQSSQPHFSCGLYGLVRLGLSFLREYVSFFLPHTVHLCLRSNYLPTVKIRLFTLVVLVTTIIV